ncbi:hypothetical protein Syun_030371 [Stephania yunnanensis]|uniref:Uncharacterized protein n=1 Tax=Stephania yunnanensis TaxID=152371 RepID=A0AAP0EBV1_9MAGN
MTSLSLNPENPAFQLEWALKNTTSTFFKCIRWKVEATDLVNCPFHYYCDGSYPSDYPPIVDILVTFFAVALFLSTLIFTVSDISRFRGCSRRYWLPSGPIALPFLLLALAKGHRVNTIIQVSCIGPALVQLLQISALAFEIKADNDFKYTFLEVSTVSGVLHASLYMDAILLPYYTGLDALLSSKFSGECATCVCRKEELKAGGRLGYLYRGWSVTMYCVVAALCFEKSSPIYALQGETLSF